MSYGEVAFQTAGEIPLGAAIDELRIRADAVIAATNNGPLEGAARFEQISALRTISESADLRQGLRDEATRAQTLGIINDLVWMKDFPFRTAEIVWNNNEIISETAMSGETEAALLAQRIIFKALCERNPFPEDTVVDWENRLLAALRLTLPSVMKAITNDRLVTAQDPTQLELLMQRLLFKGDLAATQSVIDSLELTAGGFSSPNAAVLSSEMLSMGRELIGGTMPESSAEFAYRVHVTNLINRLKSSDYRNSPQQIRQTIQELDAAGKPHGFETILWDQIADHLLEEGRSLHDHDSVHTIMLLEHYGLDYFRLRSAWETSSGFKRSDAKYEVAEKEHLERIVQLERNCFGAAKQLNAPPYRVRSFARVPLDALLNQYRFINNVEMFSKQEKYALIGLGIYENALDPVKDSHGANSPTQELPVWTNLHDQAVEHEVTLVFHEGDGIELMTAFLNARRRYGTAAEFGVAKWHNGGNGPIGPKIGGGDSPLRDHFSQSQMQHLRFGRGRGHELLLSYMKGAIKRHGELLFWACHAGVRGNTAETLNYLTGISTVGPTGKVATFEDKRIKILVDPLRPEGNLLVAHYVDGQNEPVPHSRYGQLLAA